MKKAYRLFATACALLTFGGICSAQDTYPTKPIRMVISFPPGGTSDFVGRVVGEKLGRLLGQPIVVDNQPGAAGVIGTVAVKQAAPDGYTILLVPSDFTILPSVQRKPAFDPVKDFAPVGLLMKYPHVLVTSTDVPAKDVGELVKQAASEPGKLNFASGGVGASNHISGEWFKYVSKAQITHVPYKGNGPAITDLVANRVQLLFTSIAPVEGFLKAGQLKAIGVTGKTRLASLPDVPTFDESGLPGYEFYTWYGLVAPAGTPAPVIDRLNAALTQAMASDDVKGKLASIGGDLTVTSPAAFSTMLAEEFARWKKLVKETGIVTQ